MSLKWYHSFKSSWTNSEPMSLREMFVPLKLMEIFQTLQVDRDKILLSRYMIVVIYFSAICIPVLLQNQSHEWWTWIMEDSFLGCRLLHKAILRNYVNHTLLYLQNLEKSRSKLKTSLVKSFSGWNNCNLRST